jgi:hypothetical protein
VAIKEIVLELVLVATQAPVAGTIAVLGAVFENPECVLEDYESEIADAFCKPRATRQRARGDACD